MKFAVLGLGLAATLAAASAQDATVLQLVRDDFDHATAQYARMLDRIGSSTGNPRTFANGRLTLVGSSDWTSGFFPGALWYLYEYTGDTKWRDAAIRCTAQVENAKTLTTTHDVGFILNCSFGNGYRLTGDPSYRQVLLTGAASLSTRFNPVVGCIKSWDNRPPWKYPVIIDNMMNLELLLWAADAGPSPALAAMAISHADKTRDNHFRPDASSYHVVSYNPDTGAVEAKQTAQGAFDESAWARGQAWGLYGFTMMYRKTGHADYLDLAKRIAAFLIHHPRLPADKIPYWDFDAPTIPDAPRDTSAAAIMSSALLELSGYVDAGLAQQYVAFAEDQLRSLSSPAYRAALGDNGDFLLMHGTGNLPGNSEVDVPLVYGDYYYLEALTRYAARFGPAGGLPPVFSTTPASHTVTPGSTVVLTAHASGSPTPTYVWSLNGEPVPGATASRLIIAGREATAGRYTCTATNSAGAVTTDPALLTLSSAPASGRLVNLSARAVAGTGTQTLIVGFHTDGGSAGAVQPMLIRGMGRSLGIFGLTAVLADPVLTVYRGGTSTSMASNDNWDGDPQVAACSEAVGAFPFISPQSNEAAIIAPFTAGGYTAHVVGRDGATGIALAELYDATPGADYATTVPRLTNLSARAQAGPEANAIFIGFVIGGSTAKTVLIRGVGPGLSIFGLTDTLADPRLRLFDHTGLIADNDDWGGDRDVSSVGDSVGAFPLVDPASKDAALLLTLEPGVYSAQLDGMNHTTGVALAEVYEVP